MNNLIKFIGKRIIFFRRIQGISQDELAEEVAIKKDDLQAIEKGQKDPSVTKLYKIAQFLQAKIEDFFPNREKTDEFSLLYKQLKRPNQEKVFHFARHLLLAQTKVIDLGKFINKPAKEQNFKIHHIPIQADFVFLIDDSSMEDIIPKGTPVFCRTQPKVKDGEIAVLEVFRLGTICRKISYDFEEGLMVLQPLNTEFSEMRYEPEQVKVIGIVLNV